MQHLILALLRTTFAGVIALLPLGGLAQYHGKGGLGKSSLELRGSATIGQELMPALLRAFLIEENASDIIISGEGSLNQMLKAHMADGSYYTSQIVSEGSSIGFKSYQDGDGDIVMSSRKVRPADAGIHAALLDSQHEHPICIDAITIIVHESSPLTLLSVAELRDIFCGAKTDWSEVSADMSGPIHLYGQPATSGTMDFFQTAVMKSGSLAANATVMLDQHILAADVAQDNLAIGFVAMPFAQHSKTIAISLQPGTKGIRPDMQTLMAEGYPLARKLYLYTEDDRNNPHVGSFLRFMHTGESAKQTILAQGYIPIRQQQ